MLGALPFCFVEPLSLKCLKIKCYHWTQDFDPTSKQTGHQHFILVFTPSYKVTVK